MQQRNQLSILLIIFLVKYFNNYKEFKMMPIRVLIIIAAMNRGGAETSIMNFYRNLDRNKVQYDFLVHTDVKSDYDDEITLMGGKIYQMPTVKMSTIFQYRRELEKFLQEHPEYKIIHSHRSTISSLILGVPKKMGIKCRISHVHGSNPGRGLKGIQRQILRYHLKNVSTHCFACGEAAAIWAYGKKIYSSGKIKVIRNGIDLDMYSYSISQRKLTREQLGLEDNDFVMGHVGRFNFVKNHSFLIDVFSACIQINPNAKLLLVGGGELENDIRKKVHALGLNQSVRFLGVREDVNNLLQAMDVFVFPSVFEGVPLSLIEAQASGLQCVISDTVPKECAVTELCKFISLNEDVNKWAKEITKTNVNKREAKKEMIATAGYDIKSETMWLQNFYINEYDKEN